MSNQSDGENSHSERDSTRDSREIQVPHTLPLSKQPDKGILKKKMPRSADDLMDLDSNGEEKRSSALEMIPLRSINRNSRLQERPISAENGELEHMLPQQPLSPHDYEDINDYVDPEGENEECLSCCSSDEKKDEDFLSGSDFDDDEDNTDAKDQETQTDQDSSSPVEVPRGLSTDSLEGAKSKIMKLKNINDLLRQIDEQFNSVLRQTNQGDLSPSNHSDELRGSETEADRQFPRNSFYKQSDIEEGYSPPHRSPVLSPTPGTQQESPRYSSDSPDALPSPGAGLSPILPTNPGDGPTPSTSGLKQHATSTPIPASQQPGNHLLPGPSSQGPSQPIIKVRPNPPPGGCINRTHPTRDSRPSSVRPPAPSAEYAKPVKSPKRGSPPSRLSPTGKRSPTGLQPATSTNRNTPPVSSGNVGHDSSPVSSINKNNSNMNNPGSFSSGRGSPARVESIANAIPYRGVKTSSPSTVPRSPPVVRHKTPETRPPGLHPDSDTKSPNPSTEGEEKCEQSGSTVPPSGSTPGKTSPKPPGLLHKLTHPSQFRKRATPSPNDGHSISEGYHSDKADPEDAIIVREIPGKKPTELPFLPNPSGAYTRAPGSPGSPEDINV